MVRIKIEDQIYSLLEYLEELSVSYLLPYKMINNSSLKGVIYGSFAQKRGFRSISDANINIELKQLRESDYYKFCMNLR